jgi:hypothetical protein
MNFNNALALQCSSARLLALAFNVPSSNGAFNAKTLRKVKLPTCAIYILLEPTLQANRPAIQS